jgi:hypothetical protein
MKTIEDGLQHFIRKPEAHHPSGPVFIVNAMGSFRLQKLQLHGNRLRLVHTGDTATRQRFEGDQGQCSSPRGAGGGGLEIHLSG